MRFFVVAEKKEESEEESRQKMAEVKENRFCRFCKNAAIVEEKRKGRGEQGGAPCGNFGIW